MATPGAGAPSVEQIRAGQEAMGRAPAAVGTVQAGLIEDMNNGLAQAGLDKAAGRVASFPAIRNSADNNIGHRNNLGVMLRPGVEGQLHGDAMTRINLLDNFISNGYDGMGADQAVILAEVQNTIRSSAEMASRFAGLPPADLNAEINRMAEVYLHDPNYRNRVVELILKRADITKVIKDEVTEIFVKLEDLRAERLRLTQAGGEQPVANQAETDARDKLRLYQEDPNPPAGAGVAPNNGRFYVELQTNITRSNTLTNQIDTLENVTIPDRKNTIESLNSDRIESANIENIYNEKIHKNPAYDPNNPAVAPQFLTVDQYLTSRGLESSAAYKLRITTERGRLTNDESRLNNRKNDLAQAKAEITRINEEKANADKDYKAAQLKKKDVDDKVTKLDKDINENTAKNGKLDAEKILLETEWVRQLQNIIRDATSDQLHEELPMVAQMAKTRLEKDAADAKTNNEKRFLDRLSRRYFDGRFEPQTQNINGDFNILMSQGQDLILNLPDPNNPNATIQSTAIFLDGSGLALARSMGAFDVIPGETVRQRNQRSQGIYDQLNDVEFRSSMSSRVAQEILTARLLTGHLSKREIQAIEKSTWGPGMVVKALEGKTHMRGVIDNLIGKDVLNWGDNLTEQLKKLDWTKMLMILLAIAGIIGVVAVVKRG